MTDAFKNEIEDLKTSIQLLEQKLEETPDDLNPPSKVNFEDVLSASLGTYLHVEDKEQIHTVARIFISCPECDEMFPVVDDISLSTKTFVHESELKLCSNCMTPISVTGTIDLTLTAFRLGLTIKTQEPKE